MKLDRCDHRTHHASWGSGSCQSPEQPKEVSRSDHWNRYFQRYNRTAKDFSISMREAFSIARGQITSIVVDSGLVGGHPCIGGTRIPVYMVLDALEYHGSMKGVLKSYPQLNLNQVRDAIRFSKIVVECCNEY